MFKQENKPVISLLYYLFLLAVGAILLYPVFTKEASFCINPDNLHQAYPFFCKLATSLHKGYLPVWDANTYSGKNFSGEFQSGIFYLPNLAFCWLFGSAKGIDVYYLDLLVCLHYFICLFGMYRLARVLRLNPIASSAAAIIFTFTGVMSARSSAQTCVFYGIAWMPWAISFTAKFYFGQQQRKINLFITGAFCGLEILAGHIQPFFHTVIVCGGMITFYEYNNRKDWTGFIRNTLTYSLIITLTAILVSLPQDYYAAQYLSRAYRWVGAEMPIGPGEKVPFNVYAYHFIIKLTDIANLFNKDYSQPDDANLLYMGILPLFLMITFIVRRKLVNTLPEHAQLRKFLTLVLWLGILSTAGYVTFFCVVLYEIPFVNSVRELGRYGVLINLSCALLAGLAINYISQLQQTLFANFRPVKTIAILVLCLNAVYLAFFEKKHLLPRSMSLPFLLAFLFFLALLKIQRTRLLYSLFLLVLFADVFLNRVNFTDTNSEYYVPRYYARNSIFTFLESTYGKYRVAMDFQNDEQQRRNLGDIYNIQLKMGYCATMNKPYFDFIASDWALNSEVNDLLNVKYIITDKLLDSNFIIKDSAARLRLYERKNYYPRAYWKSQLGKTGPEIENENKENIRQTAYSDLYQKIEVNCPANDTLIVSENFYPGWKCYDNGKRIQLYAPAIRNYPPIFRAVALDKGRHTLEFRYNKPFIWF